MIAVQLQQCACDCTFGHISWWNYIDVFILVKLQASSLPQQGM